MLFCFLSLKSYKWDILLLFIIPFPPLMPVSFLTNDMSILCFRKLLKVPDGSYIKSKKRVANFYKSLLLSISILTIVFVFSFIKEHLNKNFRTYFQYKWLSAKLLIFLIQNYTRSQLSNTNFGHEFSKFLSMTYRQIRQIEFLSSFHVLFSLYSGNNCVLDLDLPSCCYNMHPGIWGKTDNIFVKNTILKSLNEYPVSSNALFTHLGINASIDSVENPLAPATSCPK